MTKSLRALVLLLVLGISFVPSISRPQSVGGPPTLQWQSAAILWDPRAQSSSVLPRPLFQARADGSTRESNETNNTLASVMRVTLLP